MPHLIAISIGPVQDFIAAARKTRDLWYGSEMLSEVSRHVARTLQDQHGAELIFPHPSAVGASGDDRPAVANKILASLSGADPRSAANDARDAATHWLVERYESSLNRLGGARQYIDEEIASRQVKHALEFYSAWTPFDPDRDDYAAQRERVERLLAGRKALRNFLKADGKAGVPKSSLDPSRESVLRPDSDDAVMALSKRLNLTRHTQRDGQVRLSEHLDGISLIKRVGGARGGQARFPSVVRVAVDPYIRNLKQRAPSTLQRLYALAQEAAELGFIERLPTDGAHTALYQDFPFDSQMLFADDPDIPSDDANGARIKAEVARLVGNRVPTHFAVLVADGDRMGEHLGTLTSIDAHRQFSRRLADFARQAGETVRDHRGVLVYSGGDDVLAFLPIDLALECADQLRRDFKRIAGDDLNLSAGISAGYYRDPLWLALERGRAALQAAKQIRNALAVAWHTRSGGSASDAVVTSWNDDPVTDWERWIERFARGEIPSGSLYELRALALEYRPLFQPGSALAGLDDLIEQEVRRVLRRKRTDGGSRALGDALIDEIAARCQSPEELEELVKRLIVARRFAQILPLAAQEVIA